MDDDLKVIGWREWLALPDLGIPAIKAKVDTGARSSALHTHDYEVFEEEGRQRVCFHLHPLRRRNDIELECVADVTDFREVRDSGGHVERRPFIESVVRAGEYEWTVALSLTNREQMRFRMLLGRAALAGRFTVDAGTSYRFGKISRRAYYAR